MKCEILLIRLLKSISKIEIFVDTLENYKDYPCHRWVNFKFFSLDKFKDEFLDKLLKQKSPKSLDALALASDFILLIEFKSPWSKEIEKAFKCIFKKFEDKKEFPIIESKLIKEHIEKDPKIKDAIKSTAKNYKFLEKLEDSCNIINKTLKVFEVKQNNNIPCHLNVYFYSIIEADESFLKYITSNSPLLKLRKLNAQTPSAANIIAKVVEQLKEAIKNECSSIATRKIISYDNLKCKIEDLDFLSCPEFRIFLQQIKEEIAFPSQPTEKNQESGGKSRH